MCSANETGALSYDKFSFAKDSDKCTIEFTATHKAGCGTVKSCGHIQLFKSSFGAVILIALGIDICFFGGLLIKYLRISFSAFLIFLLCAIILCSFGTFSVLEEDNETTGFGIIKGFVGFIISAVVAIAAGFFAKNLFVFTILDRSFMFSRKKWTFITALMGAYLVVLGLSFFLDPNTAQIFANFSEGKFELSGYDKLYFLLLIVLSVAGNYVQKKKNENELN
jgi:hypothetical protein